MKKIIILTLVLALFIVSLFVFNGKKESNKIVVSEVTHSVFYAPWYVSLENGYFKDEGTVYVFNNSNEKLITFASLTKRDGQFIVGPCNLKNNFKMSDLMNKKLLAGRSGGMPLLMFKYALKESGIDESKVNIDTSVEFASLSGAFISKQGEFVNLFEPNALNIEKQKYGCVLTSLGNISGVVPYTTFYAKEDFIKNNKETIHSFRKALNKGLEFVKNNDYDTIAKSIQGQFPDLSFNDLKEIVKRYKDADSWYETTYVNKNDYDRLLNIMLYGKTIDEKVNIDLLITND